jgi:hypothetical protein
VQAEVVDHRPEVLVIAIDVEAPALVAERVEAAAQGGPPRPAHARQNRLRAGAALLGPLTLALALSDATPFFSEADPLPGLLCALSRSFALSADFGAPGPDSEAAPGALAALELELALALADPDALADSFGGSFGFATGCFTPSVVSADATPGPAITPPITGAAYVAIAASRCTSARRPRASTLPPALDPARFMRPS